MLDKEIIRPSDFRGGTPVIFVKKKEKDGSLCFVCDFLKRQVRSKNVFLICCRELEMKYYSQKNYIKVINIFRVIAV